MRGSSMQSQQRHGQQPSENIGTVFLAVSFVMHQWEYYEIYCDFFLRVQVYWYCLSLLFAFSNA